MVRKLACEKTGWPVSLQGATSGENEKGDTTSFSHSLSETWQQIFNFKKIFPNRHLNYMGTPKVALLS